MTARVTGCGEGAGLRFQIPKPVTTATSNNAPTLSTSSRRLRERIAFTATVGTDAPVRESLSAIHFNSSQTSLAACHRFSGSLAKHFFTTRSSGGGVIGWSEYIAGGSRSKIAAIKL